MIEIDKTFARDKDGKLTPITVKIYDKETNDLLMEFEMPREFKKKDEVWTRIPGALIQDIQLEDGTDFIEQYGNYDKYEFEVLLKEKNEEKNRNYQ